MKYLFILPVVFIAFANTLIGQSGVSMFQQDISWSPDGKYLAFSGMHDVDRKANTLKADIYVIGVDGSGFKMISSEDKNEFYTSWAKGRVSYGQEVPGTKDSNIFSANPDGSDVRQITKGPGKNAMPSLSRDGKRIAFASTRDTAKYQIYVMNVDGSNVTRVTRDDSVAYFNPQISPDGKRIVFYAEKGDQKDQIWTINPDGSNATLLTANIGHNTFPGWSPDGKKIIFTGSNRETKTDGTAADGTYIYTMNADGSNVAKVGNIKSFFARLSPDGKKIAYIAGGFPATQIYIANADGSGAMQITK